MTFVKFHISLRVGEGWEDVGRPKARSPKNGRMPHFLMTARATPFRRRYSNRSAVLPSIITKMFLALFWSETTFYSRRGNSSGISAWTFAVVRSAEYEGWQHLIAASVIALVIVAPI